MRNEMNLPQPPLIWGAWIRANSSVFFYRITFYGPDLCLGCVLVDTNRQQNWKAPQQALDSGQTYTLQCHYNKSRKYDNGRDIII